MTNNGVDEQEPVVPDGAEIRCKPKHRALKKSSPGNVRRSGDLRSRCPGWASDELQQKLLAGALIDTESGTDLHGRPRRLWNAVNGFVDRKSVV